MIAKADQPREDCCEIIAATGYIGRVGREVQQSQNRAALLIEQRFRSAGFDAFGNGFIADMLVLHPHIPERRTCNDMGDHEPQRDGGMIGQHGPRGGVAVQIDIGLHGTGRLAALVARRLPVCFGPAVLRFERAGFLRFPARQPTFMAFDFALLADADEDLAALVSGRALIFP